MRMLLRWMIGVLSIVLIGVLVGACRPREPQVVDLPTLAVLPSSTFTATPSRTPFPTWTNTVTPSLTPSNTPTATLTPSYTWTPTYTPTFTYTPSNTFTPSHTPTFTPTPSVTPSLTITLTLTPSITPSVTNTSRPTLIPPTATVFGGPSPTPTVPLGPTIFSFSANASSVVNGSPVLLTWASDAETAQIEQIDSTATRILQSVTVPASGQYSIVAQSGGASGRQAIFRLVAARNGVVQTSSPLLVALTCPAGWFFGDQFAPPGSGCPAAVGAVGAGAFQRFENGFMIYTNANGLNRICTGQNAGQQYICVSNGWNGQTINTSPAPDGRFIPGQMFNWAYYNTLGIGGTWNSLIGWGVMDIAVGDRTIQWENAVGGQNPFYIDTADGTVIRFSGGDTGTWQRIR